MSVAAKPPPQRATQDGNSNSPKSDSLKDFLKHIIKFASSSELQLASDIIREFDHQKEQINKLSDQDKDHTITIKMMAATIEKDKKTQEDSQAQTEALKKDMVEKDKVASAYLEKLNALGKDAEKLQSEKSQEIVKVSRLSDDITSLQKNLKEKNALIDKMVASQSSFGDRLRSEEKKSGDLQKECASLKRIIEESQLKLQKLEGFRGSYPKMDEDSM